MLNWRLFNFVGFTQLSRAEIKKRISKSLVYLFLVTSLVSVSSVATSEEANAAQFSITYVTTGGSLAAPSTQTQSVDSEELTISNYTGTKNSMRFIYWNTASDGSGSYYKAGDKLTPTAAVTLYAIWMGGYCPEGWTWSEPTCTKSFSSTGNFIIPWGFKALDVTAIGGAGGNGAKGVGGVPGKIQANYLFSENDNLQFFPGGKGLGTVAGADTYPNANYNGGTGLTNNGGSGGGGAATIVTKNGNATSDVIIVAGGGGGGGSNSVCSSQHNKENVAGQTTNSPNAFTYGQTVLHTP